MSALFLSEFKAPKICGDDCKYDDSFLLIEQEIDKGYSVTQDSTDWSFVTTSCEELLENKTKDLKLVSWWLFSNWKKNEWIDFDNKIEIYIDFLEKFSLSLYPKSEKAKKNIFNWLNDSLVNEIIALNKSKNLNYNHSRYYELFKKLDLTIKSLLQNEDDNFKKIVSFLKPFFDDEQEKQKEKTQVSEKKANPEHSVPQVEINEIASDADANKLLSQVKKLSSLLSSFYRSKDFADLKALRISNFLSWLETDGLPFAEGKTTFLYPPAELEIDEINDLLKEEKYKEAVCLIEEIIEVSPFWFDGHLQLFEIYEKTNNQSQAIEVKNALLSFIKTNEGILDFYFNDKTAFASNRVKKWIKKELSQSSSFVDEEPEESELSTEIAVERIYELANKGEIKKAMQELSDAYKSSKSMEEKFNWRLNHAQLAVEFGKKDIALALFEDLLLLIEKFNLDEWNPSLVSRVYSTVLNSFTNMDMEPERLENIYKKLCKADINSAFEIELK